MQRIFLILLLGALFIPVPTFAHGITDTDLPIVEKIGTCIDAESQTERLACYADLCTPDYKCAQSLLVAATEERAPAAGIAVLHDLMDSRGSYGITSDGHELAHIVGRQAAKHFGLSGEIFLQCPRDFFYGCGHGFFEIALALADSQSGAAVGVCGSLPEGQRFVCYHGVGHGLMMSHGDRVKESLAICNQLPKAELADEGCWQGVFMENVNTFIRREALKGVFKAKDPLAPCDAMPAVYDRECYLNQAAVLADFAHNSMKKASMACLKASPTGIGPCLEGLGQFATNPGWQEMMSGKTYSDAVFLPRAVELCKQFPAGHIIDCETAAAGNLINYDSTDQALVFCGMIEEDHQDACLRKIVMEINRPLIAEKDRMSFCGKLPSQYASLCIPPSVAASVTTVKHIPKTTLLQRLRHVMVRIITAPFRFLVYISSSAESPAPTDGVSDAALPTDFSQDQTVIHYVNDTFVPNKIAIPVGTTVLWINDGDDYLWPASDDHPTHTLYPAFDAKRAVTQAKPWSFTFDKIGTWTFHNHLSPDARGTVTVE